MNNSTKIAIVLFLIVMIIAWPIFILAAINTLFPLLSIPYNFLTWLSVIVLNMSTFGGLSYTIKNACK